MTVMTDAWQPATFASSGQAQLTPGSGGAASAVLNTASIPAAQTYLCTYSTYIQGFAAGDTLTLTFALSGLTGDFRGTWNWVVNTPGANQASQTSPFNASMNTAGLVITVPNATATGAAAGIYLTGRLNVSGSTFPSVFTVTAACTISAQPLSSVLVLTPLTNMVPA